MRGGLTTKERRELAQLRKENRGLRRSNDILQAAANRRHKKLGTRLEVQWSTNYSVYGGRIQTEPIAPVAATLPTGSLLKEMPRPASEGAIGRPMPRWAWK